MNLALRFGIEDLNLQELSNLLPPGRKCAALLTQIEVDPRDPAFTHPTKPIGPLYSEPEARRLQRDRGWTLSRDGTGWLHGTTCRWHTYSPPATAGKIPRRPGPAPGSRP